MGADRHTTERAGLAALIANIPPACLCSQQAHGQLLWLRCWGAARLSSIVLPGAGDVSNHIVNSTMTT